MNLGLIFLWHETIFCSDVQKHRCLQGLANMLFQHDTVIADRSIDFGSCRGEEGNDHAFARKGGEHYDEAAAVLARKRSAEFFAAHLNG